MTFPHSFIHASNQKTQNDHLHNTENNMVNTLGDRYKIFSFHGFRIAIINKSTNKCWGGCGERTLVLLVEMQIGKMQPL